MLCSEGPIERERSLTNVGIKEGFGDSERDNSNVG